MSAVITNVDDLEFVWRAASDGFEAGVNFKVWLANSVIQLRADLQAAQERIAQFEAALAFSDAEVGAGGSAEAERYWQETAEQERNNAADQRERAEQLRATIAEQARQLDEARVIFRKYVMHELSYGAAWHEMCDWIEANPAQANDDHVHLSAGGKCVICGLPAPEVEPQP